MHLFSRLIVAADEVDEGLKHALGTAAVTAAVLSGSTSGNPQHISKAEHENEVTRQSFKGWAAKQETKAKELATAAADKYPINPTLAIKVARLALKHQKPGFPRAEDILAVCGIESSFKPNAVSALKKDPAVGLMQIRPAVWKLDRQELQGNVEAQIKTGAEILHKYYVKLGSKEAALQAYNVGLTNYMKKKGLNPRYVPKFEKDRVMYESLREDAFEFHQRLVSELPEEFEYVMKAPDPDRADASSYHIDVMRNDLVVAVVSFASLRPFNATIEVILSNTNAFSAWTDEEKFFRHAKLVLSGLANTHVALERFNQQMKLVRSVKDAQ